MKPKKNVLVIEDMRPLRELLCDMLRASDFNVHSCPDGPSALIAAKEREFHVIITDYRMPNMTGAEVAKRLRTRFPASFIVGTSIADKKDEFLAAGANAFLPKPFRRSELLDLLHGRDAEQ